MCVCVGSFMSDINNNKNNKNNTIARFYTSEGL